MASSSSPRGRGPVLHIDVDAFYVQAECVRRPELRGQPVAISQHNLGGFVAVSAAAKAVGVRKGDGIGDAGFRAILTLPQPS
jgi:DNA polymerase-4